MKYLRLWQAGLLVVVFVVWHLLTTPGLLPNFMFENDRQAAFFFGEPVRIFGRIWAWFVVNADIYQHLWVTLVETALAFAIGTVLGLGFGLWLALSPLAGAIADPYIKALNSMPRDPGADLRRLVRPRRGKQGRARRDPGVLHRLLQRLP